MTIAPRKMIDSILRAFRDVRFRGKQRLLSPLVSRSGERDAEVFGYQVRLDLSDYIQRCVYMGTYERELIAAVRTVLRPGDTFLDVGANVGFFTLLAARLVGPTGRVIAVEPSPWAAGRLAESIARNDLRHVTLIQGGLSDRRGDLTLHVPTSGGNHTPTMVHASANTVAVTVPVWTVDELLEEQRVARVDAMKMDVEGHETPVIRGAARSIAAGRIRHLMCEFNDPWLRAAGTSARELYALLVEMGFSDAEGPGGLDGAVSNRHLVLRQPARTMTPAGTRQRAYEHG